MEQAHRIVVVEGVPGIGKSTLADALVRRYVFEQPARKLRTLLHLTQAHTYGPLAADEDRGTLTVAQNLAHLDRIVSLLEWQAQAIAGERVPKLFVVVDTLHVTHCRRPGVVRFDDVAPIDRRLAALGARVISLRAAADTLWSRGIAPRRNEQFIVGYAARKWGTLEQIHAHFVDEQEAMQSDLARTRMPHLALDADGALAGYLDRAYDFWMAR